MLSYCLKCTKNTERQVKTNKRKLIILSKYAVCDSKKLSFIIKEEDSGLLSNFRD